MIKIVGLGSNLSRLVSVKSVGKVIKRFRRVLTSDVIDDAPHTANVRTVTDDSNRRPARGTDPRSGHSLVSVIRVLNALTANPATVNAGANR